MSQKRVKPYQAFIMIFVAITVVFCGLMVVKSNNAITLLTGGLLMCVLACLFGIKYDDLQADIKTTISSMIIAILILISVGILVGTWMISGTVPLMIYYGMKILTPHVFLPVVCILCTLMSTMAGTSWGTVATVGVACMGVATGLGVPLEATAGAVVVGAIFGDKISPLSDSTVLTAGVSETNLMEGIKHSLITTGPAYIISIVFFFVYGLQFKTGSVSGEMYDLILTTVSSTFNLSPILFLPPVVVFALILMKKPTIPVFTAGIVVGGILAIALQDVTLSELAKAMYSGYKTSTNVPIVDKMLMRGGMSSMLGTIGLLVTAGVFGAPLRTAGVVDILLDYVKKLAKTSKSMTTGVMMLHMLFFMITGAYYVSYPVVGSMVKDLFHEYDLENKNLMRLMLDTGTGLAPLVPWATTGVYIATTLGVSNMDFLPFASMLWIAIILSFLSCVTGIGLAKLKAQPVTNN